MKVTGHLGKWGAGVLGVVSLVLLVNLIVQLKRPSAGNAHPQVKVSSGIGTATPPAGKATAARPKEPKELDELSRYDPTLDLDLLKKLDDRPLPDLKRNPFEFVMPPVKAVPLHAAAAVAVAAAPPPLPPVDLKPMGYSEGAGGIKEAMVSSEDQIIVVHAGDSVGTRYKIIKITSTAITVEDATAHQTIDLPIPQ
jgi:hypothetical protein